MIWFLKDHTKDWSNDSENAEINDMFLNMFQ